MNVVKPRTTELVLKGKDLEYIADIQKVIALAQGLKAATDTKADAYVSFEISEIITALNRIKTQAAKNIVKITEQKKLIEIHKAQLNPCFDLPKEAIICAACPES